MKMTSKKTATVKATKQQGHEHENSSPILDPILQRIQNIPESDGNREENIDTANPINNDISTSDQTSLKRKLRNSLRTRPSKKSRT